jgi:hypothetical protein
LHGCVTIHEPKHLYSYHTVRISAKQLTAIMSRAIDRARPRCRRWRRRPARGGEGALTMRRFSTLEEAKTEGRAPADPQDHERRLSRAGSREEIEIVDGLALGDTSCSSVAATSSDSPICHSTGVSEAPAGALYVKYLAIDPPPPEARAPRAVRHADRGAGQELGVQRVILPVYARYWAAYNVLVHADIRSISPWCGCSAARQRLRGPNGSRARRLR